jgi:DNA repair protein RecO (recombination protein O)
MANALSKQENQNVYILHTYPFKETSLIVELFSEHHGGIPVVAKGARRPRSILRGMLQAFQPLQATWSGNGDIKTLHNIEWSAKYLAIDGDALICGFYLNELLIRLLLREGTHSGLFKFYHEAIEMLSLKNNLSVTLRRFELRLLQELGYQVPLKLDGNSQPVLAEKVYRYQAEYGAGDSSESKDGIKVMGQTLIDMNADNYESSQTEKQSKLLMRYLIAHYLGNKPLNSKQLFSHIQGVE